MLKAIIPAAIAAFIAVPGHACGVQTDCSVTGGAYRIDLPNAAPKGAILFAHGYRGSANGTMRNGNFRRAITEMGLAFVALDAGTTDWQLPNAPGDSAARRQRRFQLCGRRG